MAHRHHWWSRTHGIKKKTLAINTPTVTRCGMPDPGVRPKSVAAVGDVTDPEGAVGMSPTPKELSPSAVVRFIH
jgi:hypothetical protein